MLPHLVLNYPSCTQVERASSIVDDGEGVDESQGANERKGSFFSKFNKPN